MDYLNFTTCVMDFICDALENDYTSEKVLDVLPVILPSGSLTSFGWIHRVCLCDS